MRNLFESINIRATFVSLVVAETIILIAFLFAFDVARGGFAGYIIWSILFIIFFPILLHKWKKKHNTNDEIK
ncbi:MAG: hypothetical protein KAS63_08100 [Candidatus Heimdallarchaeota archaeon]|nr:hypothetical protein [Candidatus Heimdallarchaeota archaeon]MCK4955312.1 hypothetical protein [Candidatus Heimdallarchaeota archaeon]